MNYKKALFNNSYDWNNREKGLNRLIIHHRTSNKYAKQQQRRPHVPFIVLFQKAIKNRFGHPKKSIQCSRSTTGKKRTTQT